MKRGELWWAQLPPPVGRRPVVLLSRNAAYASRELITIAPVTSRIRGIRSEVVLDKANGLRKRSVASLDTISTIPKAALDRKISLLPEGKVIEVGNAIRFALGLPYMPGSGHQGRVDEATERVVAAHAEALEDLGE